MQGSAVAALPLQASSSAFGFVFSMCLSVCNTHTHIRMYTGMHAHWSVCVCVCTQSREFCVSSSKALSVHGVGRGSMHNRHIFYMSRVLFVSSLSLSNTHMHRMKKQQKKRKKNSSTRKLHAALSHTLSLTIYIAFSLASALALPLSSLPHIVCL